MRNAMPKVIAGILAVVAIAGIVWILLAGRETPDRIASEPKAMNATTPAPAASSQTTPPASSATANETKPSGETAGAAAGGGSPLETARNTEKGSLKSPYADYASVAEEGHQKFMAAGCNGCHGGTGGGGMGPPLTNEVWVYGKDDDTLFRLIALGSDELQKQGYGRKGSENVVGPMPPMGGIVKSDDDLWKIIAWIRSVNPSSAGGSSASAQ
jgi:mono/diheme cytochrome c family protein